MSPINTYEATGIFISIAIMAVALGLIQFYTKPSESTLGATGASQGAVVVVAQDGGADAVTLKEAITNTITPSGSITKLIIEDVRPGAGIAVESGHTVTVHYIGSLPNGTQFDSSYLRGEPFEFTVGGGRVIAGWEEGLLGMRVGGHRVLVIPSTMAYGNRQVGIIPPNATLVFAIELLGIK